MEKKGRTPPCFNDNPKVQEAAFCFGLPYIGKSIKQASLTPREACLDFTALVIPINVHVPLKLPHVIRLRSFGRRV